MAPKRSLASLNAEAVAAVRRGDHAAGLKLLDELFASAASQHVTHAELHSAALNRSACSTALGLHGDALRHAQTAVDLLVSATERAGLFSGVAQHPSWPRACLRMADALAGLGMHGRAALVYEAGLAADPGSAALRTGLQHAAARAARELLAGRGLERRALLAPPTPARLTLAPRNTATGGRGALLGVAVEPCGGTGGARRAARLPPGAQHAIGWLLPAEDVTSAAVAAADAMAAAADQGSTPPACPSSGGLNLPRTLLTPSGASSAMGDAYEFVRTQCHMRAPRRHVTRELADAPRLSAWVAATRGAVLAVRASGRACRVLLLGARAGVLALAALRAGATHVTCAEECLHLAASCAEVLTANGASPSSFSVTTKHPAALALGADLACPADVLVADLIDDGVLSGGLLPAAAHALNARLLRPDAVLVPAALTVRAQAVGLAPARCGMPGPSGGAGGRIDLSALDVHRWTPSQALPAPLDPDMFMPLSAPLTAWHLPMLAAPSVVQHSAVMELEVELCSDGEWCGVVVWADVQLWGDLETSTAGLWRERTAAACCASSAELAASTPGCGRSSSSRCTRLDWAPLPLHQPAVCWLDGAVPVKAGELYPLLACHNSVRLNFGLREAEYAWTFSASPSFPHAAHAIAADARRLCAYGRALRAALLRAAARKAATAGAGAPPTTPLPSLCVVDVGAGSGALSLLAAAAAREPGSADLPSGLADVSVIAAELVAPLAAAARRNVARNGASGAVTVACTDAAALERGRLVPWDGADVIVCDVFDAGLVGHQVLPLLEGVKAKLLAEGGQVVPASACMYAVGIELQVPLVTLGEDGGAAAHGVDVSALQRYWWSDQQDAVLLAHTPHVRLTPPVKALEFDFAAPVGSGYPTESVLTLQVQASGCLNAVALFFELHLAEGVTISSAPVGLAAPVGSVAATRGQVQQRTSDCPQREAAQTACRALIVHPHAAALAAAKAWTGARAKSQHELLVHEQQQHTPRQPLRGEPMAQQKTRAQASDGQHQEAQADGLQDAEKEHHWGQALHYLDDTVHVQPGDLVRMQLQRTGARIALHLQGALRPASGSCHADGALRAPELLPLQAAPRPPWHAPGAGIEDPHVWAARKCRELLAQMLQRAPGGMYPPVWRDLQVLQLHAGSLGLCAADVGALSQELALQEALAVAAARQVAMSPAACADATCLAPPLLWR